MEKAQNNVATHAKARHQAGVSREEAILHPDSRFYTWSAKLVNSIHPLKVKIHLNGLTGEVVAGEKYATLIELGGPNRRAFPFMDPAVTETAPVNIALFAAAVAEVIR